MALTIYGIPNSRAIRPLWAASELGLDFEHIALNYQNGSTRTPEFLALNPNGHIPVVVDHRPEGDVTVWESMACALYIVRHHGQADGLNLVPATPREDAEALRWSYWTITELERDALTVLMHRVAMPEVQRKSDLAEQAHKRLKVPLTLLEQHLAAQHAKQEAYLAADRFTVADLCVASVVLWVRASGGDALQAYPLVSAWAEQCLSRPAYLAVKRARTA